MTNISGIGTKNTLDNTNTECEILNHGFDSIYQIHA